MWLTESNLSNLGTYAKKKNVCIKLFTLPLFIIVKDWKSSTYPSIGRTNYGVTVQ